MWLHFTVRDARSISYYMGVVLVAEAFAMLVPFVFACFIYEWEAAARYLFWSGICAIIGTGLRMIRIYPEGLNRQQTTLLAALGWLVVALMGAFPLWFSGHFDSYFNAFFDCVAAFTTTNVSVMHDLDHLSYADNLWRFVMAFSGGIAVVTLSLTLGENELRGHRDTYFEESTEHILPRAFKALRAVLYIIVATIVLFGILQTCALLAQGFYPPHAVFHGFMLAVSASTTSGISPMENGIAYYHSWPLAFLIMIATIFGGINVRLRLRALQGNLRPLAHDTATHTAIFWWLLLLVVFIASLILSSQVNKLPALFTTGMFEFFSAATTSGFSIINVHYNPQVIPSGGLLVLSVATAIGASSGSTTGGIQLERLSIVARSAINTMRQAISPDSAHQVITIQHMGRRVVSDRLIQTSMLVFILYISMYTIGALIGVIYGYDAVSALSQSITMASNAGLSTSIDLMTAPDLLKFIYILEMWLGRLGLIAVLGIFAKLIFTVSAEINRRVLQRSHNR